MLRVVIGFLLILLGIYALSQRGQPQQPDQVTRAGAIGSLFQGPFAGVVYILIGLGLLSSTSFVLIGADRVGHLKRIYLADDLPSGRIIALAGQKGPQAEILGPGFHFRPLLNVLYQVEEFDVLDIPEGNYGQITTKDGQPMPEGMFIAPVIPDDRLASMLDAQTFLEGGGYRGPQETVLKPGSYRLNRYLFDVRIDQDTVATVIPAGQVGVVKSHVAQPGLNCVEELVRVREGRSPRRRSKPQSHAHANDRLILAVGIAACEILRAGCRDDVVTRIDIVDFAGDPARQRRQQIDGGAAHFLQRNRTPQRRMAFLEIEHLTGIADAGAGKRAHRPGRNGIDPYAPGPEIGGKIADRGFKRRLGDTHHVVVGHDPHRTAIGQGQ
jgi:hypothetical protein